MEAKQLNTVFTLIRHRRLLWNLYRYRKPILLTAGLALGYAVANCVLALTEQRRALRREPTHPAELPAAAMRY